MVLWIGSLASALAQAPAWAVDATDERVVQHLPDGWLVVFRQSDGARLLELEAPHQLELLTWRGETLVGRGVDGTFVWETRQGRLLHGYATRGPFALSEDGTLLATDRMLLRIGDPVPLDTWPLATAVGFSADETQVATLHATGPALHPVQTPPAVQRRR